MNSEDFLMYLLEKNYSGHPRDRLTPEQLKYLKQQRDMIGTEKFSEYSKIAKQQRAAMNQKSLPEQEQYY